MLTDDLSPYNNLRKCVGSISQLIIHTHVLQAVQNPPDIFLTQTYNQIQIKAYICAKN